MARAGSLAPGGRRARGRTVARHAGRGRQASRRGTARAFAPTDGGRAAAWWVVVALQPAQHSAESALNACQLLSTKIPSLVCCANWRTMLGLSALMLRLSGPLARRVEACPTTLPTRARELWKRDAHGDEKQHELTFVVFDQNVVRARAAISPARWTPRYLSCYDGMSQSLERLKNLMQYYSETIIKPTKNVISWFLESM